MLKLLDLNKAYLSSFLGDKLPFIQFNCVREPTLIAMVAAKLATVGFASEPFQGVLGRTFALLY